MFQNNSQENTDKSCCHLFPACIPYTMTYYYSTPNKYQFQILSEKNYTIKTYFFSRLKGVNIVTILLLQSLTKQILCKYCCIKNVVEITGLEPVTFWLPVRHSPSWAIPPYNVDIAFDIYKIHLQTMSSCNFNSLSN